MINIEETAELIAYLRDFGAIGVGEIPEVDQLSGGVSNRTVMVTRPSGEAWVLKQGLPKLRVETDWFCSPLRTHREAMGLQLLARLTPPGTIPELVFEDRENNLFAMEAVPRPHENWKRMLLAGKMAENHVALFARLLGTIHRRAVKEPGCLTGFEDLSFFEALRLEPYYRYTGEQIPETGKFFESLLQETRDRRVTLVHGDYSPKNILVHEERLVLLDHEVIHFGDPAFDLGFSLTHLLSKGHHLKAYREWFLRAALLFWETYWDEVASEDWTEGLEARSVRNTLGCMLARVAGRSPLEYLTLAERARQEEVIVAMLMNPPKRMNGLVEQFAWNLGNYARN